MRIDYAYDRLDRVVAINHNGQVLQVNVHLAAGNRWYAAARWGPG